MRRNPITLEALETLDAIDRRGSFAKAAEELNKATSALSYSVQKLEEQLGITLFQRQGRRSVLTPAGRLMLDEGRKILHNTAQLADKAKEVATGWEPRLNIAIESNIHYQKFFNVISEFLDQHDLIEIDVSECVLNGGWEALEQDRVALIVGAPGPVPPQKGFRTIAITLDDFVPVVAAGHPLAKLAANTAALEAELPNIRRIVTHDTSTASVTRSAGLSIAKKILYVQNIDQKVHAILAGIGIANLPRHRVQGYLDSGQLIELPLQNKNTEYYIAWKISNKGKALGTIAQYLSSIIW